MNIELVCLMLKGISKLIESEQFGMESSYLTNSNHQKTEMRMKAVSITQDNFKEIIQGSAEVSMEADELRLSTKELEVAERQPPSVIITSEQIITGPDTLNGSRKETENDEQVL